MRIDTNDMVSATEVNREAARFISEAQAGRNFVVMKNNQPVAWIVGPDAMERLQQVEEDQLDLKLLAVSLVRGMTDTGERYSLDEVASELGISEED